jgi:hypothetical protein
MTSVNLIINVRASCGKNVATNDELEDTEILQYGTDILQRIGEKIPSKALRYVTSVANQREYDVPSTVLRIQKVFPWDTVDQDLMVLGGYKVDESSSNEYYNFPSLWRIKMMRKIAGLPRIQYQFDPIDKKLILDPHPEEAGLRYYYLSVEKSKWTLANVPDDFEEVLVLGVTWKSLEQVALKRSQLGGVMREGGRVTYPATELWNLAEKRRDEFNTELQVKALIYSR